MHDRFDELAKGLAQCITRRQALRRFGVGLASAGLAMLGLANRAQAQKIYACDCADPYYGCQRYAKRPGQFKACMEFCSGCSYVGP